jgi:hypothetical protein
VERITKTITINNLLPTRDSHDIATFAPAEVSLTGLRLTA